MLSDKHSSLILLADVALDNPNADTYIRRKRRKPRMVLKIARLNGIDHAEVTDLKCLPIGTLFKMFVEKFEDKKSHSLGYVCRYGSCNSRFTDVDENRMNRLEHLLQCHLLGHLMKTKSGSMIKLPRVPVECLTASLPTGSSMQLVKTRNQLHCTNSKMNVKLPEFQRDEADAIGEPQMNIRKEELVEIESNKPTSEVVALGKSQSSENIPEEILMENSLINLESDLRKITFDHSYSMRSHKISNMIPVTSSRSSLTPIEFRSLDVNNLYCLNSESSSELNNFMLDETLKRQVPIFIIDGSEFIVEELPLVGSEIEVTTESDLETRPAVTAVKFADKAIRCNVCEEAFSSKKILLAHVKDKHSNSGDGKQLDKSLKARQCTEETKPVKRKRQSLPGDANIDLEVIKENKYISVDNFMKRCDASILKTALLKDCNGKKPVINISNIWNSINVQYI